MGLKGIQVRKLGMVLQNHPGAPDSGKKGTPDNCTGEGRVFLVLEMSPNASFAVRPGDKKL